MDSANDPKLLEPLRQQLLAAAFQTRVGQLPAEQQQPTTTTPRTETRVVLSNRSA